MTSDRILVFIPAYRCAPQIGRTLAQFHAMDTHLFEEILVLDNRSTDDTVEQALKAAEQVSNCRVTVARNHANYGLGGSHKAAFAYATAKGFTHVIVFHGDDQGNIQDVLPTLHNGAHRRYDCCLGSRFARDSKLNGYSRIRIIGNYIFNTFFTTASGRKVTDLGSGLNVFSTKLYRDSSLLRYADDLRFNCYLLLALIDSGKTFCYFPITWREEDQISNVKIVSQSLKTLSILFQYLFSRRAFRNEEHRQVQHAAYTFDILDSFGPRNIVSASEPILTRGAP